MERYEKEGNQLVEPDFLYSLDALLANNDSLDRRQMLMAPLLELDGA